jgi:hypothetical protein
MGLLNSIKYLPARQQKKLKTPNQSTPHTGRRLERETGIEPASLAWKARVLPLNYSRSSENFLHQLTDKTKTVKEPALRKLGGWGWIRTSVRVSEQIYSLPPLTTRTPILQVNHGLCHGFRAPYNHSITLRLCACSQVFAMEKCPHPKNGCGGRFADSGEG